jgi:type 1 glutamine amidotransferase
MFKDNPEVTFEALEHPKAQAAFTADKARSYDVVLLYDMWQDISEPAKADFLSLLKAGKGLVVMHHAIASYQAWPEYSQIIGGRYYLAKTTVNGVEKPISDYKHDVKFSVEPAGSKHPVIAGLQKFEIHDETYKGFDVFPGVQPLLMTDELQSNKVIAWAKTWDQSRVVYLQLGHDHFAYENPALRQFLRQAIAWTAGKTPP